MKKLFFGILLCFFSFPVFAQNEARNQINQMLDGWHKAAAQVNYSSYFDALADDAIFIGTDATENWTKAQFEAYAKPFFDKGKAWNFTCIKRNIYFNEEKNIAWFDELLNTQMKICRGSGVLVLVRNQWKIKHYVLSMTIPNDNADEIVKIKSPIEEKLIPELRK